MDFSLSAKQKEYCKSANARWNLKIGAVRSGKSYVDTAAVIPMRILDRIGLPGLAVIMGVSRETVERNILKPMREIYGENRVSFINTAKNTATIFGEEVYCLGAEKLSQVAKIQGASIKYCYGDEVCKWNKNVFEMLKSRLDKEYSCFDGAANPETATHWFKKFLDSDADIYVQHYTIFDNPYLPEKFVKDLCKEYEGTIYYDRYILGQWKQAEGSIYKTFSNNPNQYLTEIKYGEIPDICVGIDYGGNQSGHSLVATGIDKYGNLIALYSRRLNAADRIDEITPDKLDRWILDHIDTITRRYGPIAYVYYDNAETVLGNGLRNSIERKYDNIIVRGAKKIRIKDRINATLRLIGLERFYYTKDCETLKQALLDAVYSSKSQEEERLDDGTSDIDTLDAFEYSFERDITYLLREEQ